MSITGSMYAGVSGLGAQSQAVSVISNNLANASTTGFKSSSTNFEDVFYSSLSTGGSTDQIGHGVTVSSVDVNFEQGSYEDSSSVTDMAIDGDGFFIVVDPDTGDTYYTRAGDFELDENGYLCDSSGNIVQGWVADSDGDATGVLTDIQILESQSAPSATTEISFPSMNIDSDSEDNCVASNAYTALFNAYDGTADTPLAESLSAYETSITVYDENGTAHALTLTLDAAGTNDSGELVYEYTLTCDPDEDQRVVDGVDVGGTEAAGLLMAGTLTFSTGGQLTSMTAFTLDETLTNAADLTDESNWVLAGFGDNGYPLALANFTGGEDQEIELNLGLSNDLANTGTGWDTSGGIDSLDDITAATDVSDLPEFSQISRESGALTSYDSSSATYSVSQDGYAAGTLQNLIIDENGVISGLYSNGQSEELYVVALADFTNENGLYSEGSNLWSATTESGQAVIGTAGSAGFGEIASSTLESSNVDTATEMTKLIIAQSVFQANSKVITTANTLLETVIGLKR
ncbi:flagellar hook protein FlgE [Paucidesulfovibrio longus]|uniref:flagellar hook protein FlgE n=1 Tax=Paucidesulfovibrio longus TaxID=889 RepID=UPI0003B6C4E0|nr:flagellar hook protein FlgE [Paucidesulfovibrio longus]